MLRLRDLEGADVLIMNILVLDADDWGEASLFCRICSQCPPNVWSSLGSIGAGRSVGLPMLAVLFLE